MIIFVKFLLVVASYICISLSGTLAESQEKTEEIKSNYKDYLNEKNRIMARSIAVAHTVEVRDIINDACGKGYAFEDYRGSVQGFKEKYYNKMIKLTGTVGKIDLHEKSIIFNNDSDICWAFLSVRAVVDDPTLYTVGDKVSIVGRFLGMTCTGNIYIDGGQIEQEIKQRAIPAYSNQMQYDKAMSVKEIADILYTYGNGNILKNEFENKKILITGYVSFVDNYKVMLTAYDDSTILSNRVSISCYNAVGKYKVGEKVSVIATIDTSKASPNVLYFK